MIAFGIVWILFKEILGETGKGWLPMPSWYIWGGGSLWLAGGLQCLEPSPTPSSELFRPLCFADYFFLSQLLGLRISILFVNWSIKAYYFMLIKIKL